MDIKDDVTIRSWDGTWTYRPKVLVTPETPEDIVEIVKSVVRFPRRCARPGRCIPPPA